MPNGKLGAGFYDVKMVGSRMSARVEITIVIPSQTMEDTGIYSPAESVTLYCFNEEELNVFTAQLFSQLQELSTERKKKSS